MPILIQIPTPVFSNPEHTFRQNKNPKNYIFDIRLVAKKSRLNWNKNHHRVTKILTEITTGDFSLLLTTSSTYPMDMCSMIDNNCYANSEFNKIERCSFYGKYRTCIRIICDFAQIRYKYTDTGGLWKLIVYQID